MKLLHSNLDLTIFNYHCLELPSHSQVPSEVLTQPAENRVTDDFEDGVFTEVTKKGSCGFSTLHSEKEHNQEWVNFTSALIFLSPTKFKRF